MPISAEEIYKDVCFNEKISMKWVACLHDSAITPPDIPTIEDYNYDKDEFVGLSDGWEIFDYFDNFYKVKTNDFLKKLTPKILENKHIWLSCISLITKSYLLVMYPNEIDPSFKNHLEKFNSPVMFRHVFDDNDVITLPDIFELSSSYSSPRMVAFYNIRSKDNKNYGGLCPPALLSTNSYDKTTNSFLGLYPSWSTELSPFDTNKYGYWRSFVYLDDQVANNQHHLFFTYPERGNNECVAHRFTHEAQKEYDKQHCVSSFYIYLYYINKTPPTDSKTPPAFSFEKYNFATNMVDGLGDGWQEYLPDADAIYDSYWEVQLKYDYISEIFVVNGDITLVDTDDMKDRRQEHIRFKTSKNNFFNMCNFSVKLSYLDKLEAYDARNAPIKEYFEILENIGNSYSYTPFIRKLSEFARRTNYLPAQLKLANLYFYGEIVSNNNVCRKMQPDYISAITWYGAVKKTIDKMIANEFTVRYNLLYPFHLIQKNIDKCLIKVAEIAIEHEIFTECNSSVLTSLDVFAEMIDKIKLSSGMGNCDDQLKMAKMYHYGIFQNKNLENATLWYQIAYENSRNPNSISVIEKALLEINRLMVYADLVDPCKWVECDLLDITNFADISFSSSSTYPLYILQNILFDIIKSEHNMDANPLYFIRLENAG